LVRQHVARKTMGAAWQKNETTFRRFPYFPREILMRVKLIFVLAVFILVIPIQIYSQDWGPQHLVGMDYPRLALQA
jgi:hypothetical protein